MTDNFSGESDIESLAQRAKEVLDRVRSHGTDGASGVEAEVDPEPIIPVEAEAEAEIEVEAELDPEPIIPVEAEAEVEVEAELDPEPIIPVEAEIDEEPEWEPEPAPSAAASTALVATDTVDSLDHLVDDEDESSRSKLGCLLPLLLLALLVLALVLFGDRLFGSDDEDALVDATSPTVSTEVESSDSTIASTDPTNPPETTEAPTTTASTTTTTTEPPRPATAWELLTAENQADQFAAFSGPFGVRDLLERGSDEPEFTLLAPSNEAMAALPPEAVAAFNDLPEAAMALIGYHIIDQRLTPDLLLNSAGGQIESSVGLPIEVALDGDDIVLNGESRVSLAALEAQNGNVLVIDSVLSPPSINSAIELGDVQFGPISSIITPEGEAELQKAVVFFQENPEANAVIEGHTDTDGPAGPNQNLSERRANAVRDFLISQGIEGNRLTAVGLGETQPILNDGVEDKVASRRIKLILR